MTGLLGIIRRSSRHGYLPSRLVLNAVVWNDSDIDIVCVAMLLFRFRREEAFVLDNRRTVPVMKGDGK